MAWPVSGNWEARTSGVTTIKKTWADALDGAINGIYGGTKTLVSLNVDGVGNAASALGAGNIQAVGNVQAGATFSLIGGNGLLQQTRSSGTAGAGQSGGQGVAYKDSLPFAWGHFTVIAAGALTFRRGYNIQSVTKSGVGVYVVTLASAAATYLIPVCTPLAGGAHFAVVDDATYPTTSVFTIMCYNAAGTLADPPAGAGGTGGVFFAVFQG